MKYELKRGVLVVGHGSRREEANEDVRYVARRIGEQGRFPLVEAAFLEIAQPDIRRGFARLVRRGASEIIVHPYFLSPGRHARGDLPVKVREAADEFPGVRYRITEPLAAHRLVIQAAIERIRETQCPAPGDPWAHDELQGIVYLVGAGPGDPSLLTLRARDLILSCDVIIYDYLVNPEIVSLAPERAERIYVGKVGGGQQTPQADINRLLIERARRGQRVVRLKGGDPFLFGRGAEEAAALRDAGLRFEVVPGISSALAVPAYAGIPLTHRELSSSVAVLTGARAEDGALTEQIAALASAGTIVILMGAARLREIADALIAAGRPPQTPAAAIRWGTYAGQLVVAGTLRSIASDAERAGLRPPAVIIIGETVNLRERLNWFGEECAPVEELL
jgi:uroporphyrin-III C-methyltransferase